MKEQNLKDAFQKLDNGVLNQVYILKGDDYFLQEYFIKKLEKTPIINIFIIELKL